MRVAVTIARPGADSRSTKSPLALEALAITTFSTGSRSSMAASSPPERSGPGRLMVASSPRAEPWPKITIQSSPPAPALSPSFRSVASIVSLRAVAVDALGVARRILGQIGDVRLAARRQRPRSSTSEIDQS